MAYGFKIGKNKADVYTKTETDGKISEAGEILQNQITEIIAQKQAKLTTRKATLAANSWSSKQQTLTVAGVTATNVVEVTADPDDAYVYGSAGIVCIEQSANSLKFKCIAVPSVAVKVNIIIWEA